ncbi:hypothetical protein [Mycoplasmopsis columboralis]|uniref:hypothetical protein n=1 Tax=Mycoplasmopsis columboralis TaxID=171282 RepID=UPI00101CE2AB|nr:hypothetical protein [Mycoplasmopsis columboralis]
MKITFQIIFSTNVVNPQFKQLSEKFDFLNEQLLAKFGSESNRFYQNLDKLKVWKDTPELKEYKHSIENAILDFKTQTFWWSWRIRSKTIIWKSFIKSSLFNFNQQRIRLWFHHRFKR